MRPCLRLSSIAQPATAITGTPGPSNLERRRENRLLPPELQHPLKQPGATDTSTFRYHPQSSTPNLSLFPESDMEQVASPAKIHQRPGLSTSASNEAHDVSVTAQPLPLSLHHPLTGPPSRRTSTFLAAVCTTSAPGRRGLLVGDGEPPPGMQKLLSEIENDVCASFCRCVCCCLCCGYCCRGS